MWGGKPTWCEAKDPGAAKGESTKSWKMFETRGKLGVEKSVGSNRDRSWTPPEKRAPVSRSKLIGNVQMGQSGLDAPMSTGAARHVGRDGRHGGKRL